MFRLRAVRPGAKKMMLLPGNVCPTCGRDHKGKLYATGCGVSGSRVSVACRRCCKRRLLPDFGPEKGIMYGAIGCPCRCGVFTASARGIIRDLPRVWLFHVELPDGSRLTFAQVRGDARGHISVLEIKEMLQETIGGFTRQTLQLAFKPRTSSLAAHALIAAPILLQDGALLSSCDLFTRNNCILQVHVVHPEREYDLELQGAIAFHAAGLLQQEVDFGRAADVQYEAEADIELGWNAAAEHEAEVEFVAASAVAALAGLR